jgi:hypothetical protein
MFCKIQRALKLGIMPRAKIYGSDGCNLNFYMVNEWIKLPNFSDEVALLKVMLEM